MRRLTYIVAICVLAVALPSLAEVIEVAAVGTSAASTDTGEILTTGDQITFQLCGGTGGSVFSGSISVKQGNKTGKLVETWTSGTITSQSGCATATYVGSFGEAPLTQVVITRTAGTYGAWLYRYPK